MSTNASTKNHSAFYPSGQNNITAHDIEKIDTYFTYQKVIKGAFLVKENEVCDTLYFVKTGLLRTYYLTAHGSEKTRYICEEGSFITALSSFITREISFEWIEAIEDSELLCIKRNDFYTLLDQVPNLNKIYREYIESAYLHQNSKVKSLVTLSAKQRFEKMLADKPNLIHRLPHKILASYLDVNPDSLTRLKNKG